MEKHKDALRRILFMAHKRKMLKNPPPLEDWWGIFLDGSNESALELCSLIESIGDIAYEALKDEEND